jgi:hypothetical protein
VLAADPTLAAEIEYDLKQFEKEDQERKKKRASAATAAAAASPVAQVATTAAAAAKSSSGTAASGNDSANDKSSSGAMGPPATPSARSKARLSGELLLFVSIRACYPCTLHVLLGVQLMSVIMANCTAYNLNSTQIVAHANQRSIVPPVL